MCSESFSEMFENFEKVIMCGSSDFSLGCEMKVYKASKNREPADYICYASNEEISEIWKGKLIEKATWMKRYFQVMNAPKGLYLSLHRNMCFSRGIEDVHTAGCNFGCNSFFESKGFEISAMNTSDPENLANLRLNLLSDVLHRIIPACGGSLSSTQVSVKISLSSSKCNSECTVNVIVGSVVCQSAHRTSVAYAKDYKRMRLDEISEMCEHKLDLGEQTSTEDKNKLLEAVILFDFLQSSVWRSVTLRVLDERSDAKTSCKGSLFVLYNYARLFSLCGQFDEKVSAGIYPPLPPLGQVDFTLLNQEEEWKLMFHSILSWRGVLINSIKDLEAGKPKIHLIFQFLKTTSTNFSHYYHRIRIFTSAFAPQCFCTLPGCCQHLLGHRRWFAETESALQEKYTYCEERPTNYYRITSVLTIQHPNKNDVGGSHLLPVLFARVHLLKALLSLYGRALELVCIQPLNKM